MSVLSGEVGWGRDGHVVSPDCLIFCCRLVSDELMGNERTVLIVCFGNKMKAGLGSFSLRLR